MRHGNPQKSFILKKAKRWAEKIWAESIDEWIERPAQDFAYRRFVVESAVSSIIEGLNLDKNSFVVDLGCGDGSHTLFWRRQLNDAGFYDVPILGIDLLKPLIAKAKEQCIGHERIYFETGDITAAKAIWKKAVGYGQPDIVTAMFVLQDIPDLEGALRTVAAILREAGHFIAVFVHPDFADHLLQSGHIKVFTDKDIPEEYISSRGVVQWRFMGYYPIVKEEKPPFYVPYFHRHLQDYCDAIELYGFRMKSILPLMPDRIVMKRLQSENILPFAHSKWNVYWPTIIEEPSSVLIHAVK